MSEIEVIDKIQTEYFQKSTFFLYPLLRIPRELKPLNTYISWRNVTSEQCRLFCLFLKTDDPKFTKLEKQYLIKNHYLAKLHQSQNYLLYEFDLVDYKNNCRVFLEGNYSRMSPFAKQTILEYYKDDSQSYKYAHCYLNPSLYYDTYSRILEVDPDLFYEGTELARPPDLEKETFTQIKNNL